MSDPLVRVTGASLRIGERSILQQVDLQVAPGEIVTVIGPNGAGKTSLVRLVLGLQQPDSGNIYRRPQLRIGYMPQRLHIERSLPLTVWRFMQLAMPKEESRIQASLELADVGHLARSPMHGLSGGETQRVLLARALLRDPDLLVLDEPVQGVDVAGQSRLYQLIARIRNQRGCGVLMVSHDLHLVMAATDTVVCLNQHVCCHGHPETVSEHPAFLELFGHAASAGVAVYTHHHDHAHTMHGDIRPEPTGCQEHDHA